MPLGWNQNAAMFHFQNIASKLGGHSAGWIMNFVRTRGLDLYPDWHSSIGGREGDLDGNRLRFRPLCRGNGNQEQDEYNNELKPFCLSATQ